MMVTLVKLNLNLNLNNPIANDVSHSNFIVYHTQHLSIVHIGKDEKYIFLNIKFKWLNKVIKKLKTKKRRSNMRLLSYISTHRFSVVNTAYRALQIFITSVSLSLSHPLLLQPATLLSLKRGHCLSCVPRGMLGEQSRPGPQLKSTIILPVSVRERIGA